jgi:glycosyltransferase involved in cell wall biosynthesis
MTKTTIAFNVIMRDVSDSILPCLNSVGPSLDEYIFVDTGSKDKTKELVENWCRENKVKYKIIDYKGYRVHETDERIRRNWGDIPQYEWDFGDARQIALLNSTSDWIFWCDADDVVKGMNAIRGMVADAEFANASMVNMPYHYAQDGAGNDVVYQYRERLIRLRFDSHNGTAWRGRCHEYCNPGEFLNGPMMRGEIHIYHKRTMEHVIETNRRNNRILYYSLEQEELAGKREMRTLSVLAFDQYEHREWEECIKYYKQLFELVDRERQMAEPQYFSHYASYARACMAIKDYDLAQKSIERMIMVNPTLMEPYLLKAEIYVALNNLELAEEFVRLAETRPQQENMSPTSPLELKVKPLLMRVEIEGRRGNLKEAIKYLERAMQITQGDGQMAAQRRDMMDNITTKDAYDGMFALREELFNTGELDKMGNLVASVPKSLLNRPEIVSIMDEMKKEWTFYKQRMATKLKGKKKIVFFIGPAYEDWNSEILKITGSGGSEEMGARMAKELAALGHDVTVYNQCGISLEGTFDGVKYIDFRKFKETDECDVFVSERMPQVFAKRINAKRQSLWLHDTHYGDLPRKFLNLPDKIFVLSQSHKNIFKDYYRSIADEKFEVTRNGIDLDMIALGEGLNIVREPHRMVYSSSYDRGIDRLLKLFPDIKEKVPDATLDIYYGFDVYDKRMNMLLSQGSPEGQALKENKERLLELMKQEGVTHKGRVTQQEIINAYFGAGIWAYPTGFFEISCITGMIAQSCGAIPVVSDYAALSETVQRGVKLPMGYTDEKYVEEVVRMMDEKFDRQEMMDWARKTYDIKPLAKEWDEIFSS